jgi:hypothetical protein
LIVNYQSRLVQHLLQSKLLTSDLVVIDVGCSQGIDPGWRQFEPQLAGLGIDPLVPEIARLTSVESNPKVRYAEGYVVCNQEFAPHSVKNHSANWYARSSAG